MIAPKTTCGYDNLRSVLRTMFYTLVQQGQSPTRCEASPAVLAAFEGLTGHLGPRGDRDALQGLSVRRVGAGSGG
jgi:hypothetical protein